MRRPGGMRGRSAACALGGYNAVRPRWGTDLERSRAADGLTTERTELSEIFSLCCVLSGVKIFGSHVAPRFRILLIIGLTVLFFDQWTKLLAVKHLTPG